ncbi:MAG: ribosome biogenesis GTPase Der [Actinobacteria bacterium HGW-Actinobacteria-7]|nr:MAG: ribosome biogenesis GTPase Der [Actinobacteria bacterium HGW-Actinobacteria-7]
MPLPIVAVVGRPNVGKSTFVNRIAQTSDAIVHEARGVTRDRSYHRADWNGKDFLLIDTGGIEAGSIDEFQSSIRAQAYMATEEADAIVFLVDGKSGIAPDDQEVANILKRTNKPVFLAVNKVDNPGSEAETYDFWSLGLDTPYPVSATHGNGTGDLLDEIVAVLPDIEPEVDDDVINIAIIGRPNAGKSSLLNQLLGRERAIVSPVAGTTRDSIDTSFEYRGQKLVLVDTAGIRRKSLIDEDVEYYGFVRAMRAIDRADVALLVIDSTIGLTDQDQRVARFAEERGCAIIILLNKWDALDEEEDAKKDLEVRVEERMGFVGFAPVLRISALTGKGVHRIWDNVMKVYSNYTQEISTSQLNKLLTDMREFGHTKNEGGKSLRMHYVTQTRISPPGFVFFANHPTMIDDNFRRYVENRLRERFDFSGTPVILKFRKKD